jgi:hypothetical protein
MRARLYHLPTVLIVAKSLVLHFIGDTLIVAVQHPGEDTPIGGPDPLNADRSKCSICNGNLYTQFAQCV